MAHRPNALKQPWPPVPFLLLATVLQWAWLAWYWNEVLPNADNAGGRVKRAFLMWRALPYVVPSVSYRNSHLSAAVEQLSHFENLPERLPIVLCAALMIAAALALGQIVLRLLKLRPVLGGLERVALSYGVGAVGLSLITLGLGRLGFLRGGPFRLGLILLTLAGLVLKLLDRRRPQPETVAGPTFSWRGWLGLVLVAGPFLLAMFLGSMVPQYDYDAIEYHLEGPKEYFQAGKIQFLGHNVYTSMPFGIEMLHLLGMVVAGDWWTGALAGQVLVACFAPATAAVIAAAARRWASSRAAWLAALVYLTTPWVYRIAVIAYVEGPLCYFHAALVWAAGRAWDELDDRRSARFWLLVGVLAGAAMSCKYTALITAVVPFGVLAVVFAVRRKALQAVVAFGIGCALVIGPWLIKNVIDTGNPVYPLGYRVFGGKFWNEAREIKWSAAHGRRPVSARMFWDSVVDVAGRSDWQSPLYTAFLPLAFWRRESRRIAAILATYVAYIFLTWWLLTHRLDRFWLPLLPVAAILAGMGADWSRRRLWTALLTVFLIPVVFGNFIYVSTALAGPNEWTTSLFVLRGTVPMSLNPPLAKLDADLPAGSKVLLVGQAAVFHMRHAVVYNTVFNDEILETLTRDRSPADTQRELLRMGVDYVYVDWREIARFRSPGNYGFTAYMQPEVLDRLVAAGVLEPMRKPGVDQDLYRVRKAEAGWRETGDLPIAMRSWVARTPLRPGGAAARGVGTGGVGLDPPVAAQPPPVAARPGRRGGRATQLGLTARNRISSLPHRSPG